MKLKSGKRGAHKDGHPRATPREQAARKKFLELTGTKVSQERIAAIPAQWPTGPVKSVAVSEFKAHCLSLLEDVARTGEPLLVTKRGRPLARITPAANRAVARPQDTLRGSVSYEEDWLAPVLPAEAWNAVRGVPLPEDDSRPRRKRARGGA